MVERPTSQTGTAIAPGQLIHSDKDNLRHKFLITET